MINVFQFICRVMNNVRNVFFEEHNWKSINEREHRFFNRKKSRANSLIYFISQQGNKNTPTRILNSRGRLGFSFPATWYCFKTLPQRDGPRILFE